MLAAGTWAAEASDDRITLDFDARHRRRVRMTSDNGLAFLLDLPDARLLRDGDCLALDNGKRVRVCAAPEKLLEVTCSTAEELVRTAYHLGNRHLSVQVLGMRLRMRDDYVIADMLRHMGATVSTIEAPFDPEVGAYAHGHGHGHG